jgi:hypothetical protein
MRASPRLLQAFPFHPDQVHPQDGVVVEGRQFGRGVLDQHLDQRIHVDARFFHQLSR